MGYTIAASLEAAVDPAAVFALYMDPSSWSVWGHNVRWARSQGALVEGGIVDIRPKYPVTYHCRVVRLVPGRLLKIEVRPIGMTIINVYEIEPASGGSRIRHALEMSGPLSVPIRLLGVARLYRSSLEDEIHHCVELAQARSTALG
jgi:polyketide cyclase/dehydrase/lipid transport protein